MNKRVVGVQTPPPTPATTTPSAKRRARPRGGGSSEVSSRRVRVDPKPPMLLKVPRRTEVPGGSSAAPTGASSGGGAHRPDRTPCHVHSRRTYGGARPPCRRQGPRAGRRSRAATRRVYPRRGPRVRRYRSAVPVWRGARLGPHPRGGCVVCRGASVTCAPVEDVGRFGQPDARGRGGGRLAPREPPSPRTSFPCVPRHVHPRLPRERPLEQPRPGARTRFPPQNAPAGSGHESHAPPARRPSDLRCACRSPPRAPRARAAASRRRQTRWARRRDHADRRTPPLLGTGRELRPRTDRPARHARSARSEGRRSSEARRWSMWPVMSETAGEVSSAKNPNRYSRQRGRKSPRAPPASAHGTRRVGEPPHIAVRTQGVREECTLPKYLAEYAWLSFNRHTLGIPSGVEQPSVAGARRPGIEDRAHAGTQPVRPHEHVSDGLRTVLERRGHSLVASRSRLP